MGVKRATIRYYEPRCMHMPKERDFSQAIDEVLAGRLAGIALRESGRRRLLRPPEGQAQGRVRAKLAHEGYVDFGSVVSFRQKPVYETFRQESSGSLLAKKVLRELWADGNITGLHADQREDTPLLSLVSLRTGAMQLDIFSRGPEIAKYEPNELFDTLREDTQRALVDQQVDPSRLHPGVTRLTLTQPGDVALFNSHHPHMAISLGERTRHSTSQFFEQVAD